VSTTVTQADRRVGDPTGPSAWSTALRVLGWVLIAAGVVVGLFIVYLLFWTDRQTAAAQEDLVQGWEELVLPEAPPADEPLRLSDLANIPVQDQALPAVDEPDPDPDEPDSGIPVPTDPGDSYALLWFQRGDEFIVTDGPVGAVQGVTLDDLQLGPGHYPDSEAPGQAGNVAFAGHRTTYGKPFHNIDLLEPGDEIHLVDGRGRHWVYDFREIEIVSPSDVWVVDDGALDGVENLLTLTSCHPKYSAQQRIVAFAELREGAGAVASDGSDLSDGASTEASEAADDTTIEAGGVR